MTTKRNISWRQRTTKLWKNLFCVFKFHWSNKRVQNNKTSRKTLIASVVWILCLSPSFKEGKNVTVLRFIMKKLRKVKDDDRVMMKKLRKIDDDEDSKSRLTVIKHFFIAKTFSVEWKYETRKLRRWRRRSEFWIWSRKWTCSVVLVFALLWLEAMIEIWSEK